ncbi:MAG: hypothetical protein HKN25_16090 [Pyrinomonadaceae bacterium]|nr:hypothetical protein [Pyrinomonadaceae bacterium]
MKAKILSLLFLSGMMSFFAVSATAQNKFSDPNVEYTFGLPEDEWKMTVKPSEYSPNVEFVYNYKKEGHLQIRRLKVEEDALFSEIIREEEQKLQFVPGYVAGKEENFRGAFSGRVFNYEFVRSGRPMSGRFYFLRAEPTKIYILRFTGLKDSLRAIRNQTDSIARTFSIKNR